MLQNTFYEKSKQGFITIVQSPLTQFITVLERRMSMLRDSERIEDAISQEEQEALELRTIMCPHGKKAYVRSTLFVIAYYHANDEQSCNLLNEFNTSVQDISDAMITEKILTQEKLHDTPGVRALLAASPKAREKMYSRLSAANEDTLADLLEQVLRIYTESRSKSELLQELVSRFGMPVVRNAKIIFQLDLSQKIQTRSLYLPMVDLSSKHIRGIVEIKAEAKTEAKKAKRQTLDDILFG